MNQPIPLHLRILFAGISIIILVSLFTFLSFFLFIVIGIGLIATLIRIFKSNSNNMDSPEKTSIYRVNDFENDSKPVIEIEGKVIK